MFWSIQVTSNRFDLFVKMRKNNTPNSVLLELVLRGCTEVRLFSGSRWRLNPHMSRLNSHFHQAVRRVSFMTLPSKCKLGYVSGMWQCIKSVFQQHQQLFVMTLRCSSTCEEIKWRVNWDRSLCLGFFFFTFTAQGEPVRLSFTGLEKYYECISVKGTKSSLSLNWDEPFYDLYHQRSLRVGKSYCGVDLGSYPAVCIEIVTFWTLWSKT